MNYASDEKLKIIQWLAPRLEEGQILAAELPFKNVSRKADIAIISPKVLSAIEVKGPRDNLDGLAQQMEDYERSFLEVHLALAPIHYHSAKKLVRPSVGLIELSAEGAKMRRKARTKQFLASLDAADWLRTGDLARLLGPQSRALGIQSARKLAIAETSRSKLTAAALEAAYRKALSRYNAFVAERGEFLTLDDVAMLELPTRIR
ncbi:sce7726 family protein [Xanthomonas campestris pv. olitorii]|nr:sce7726 family protein [Xanthomonas campestris pv. olitorii]